MYTGFWWRNPKERDHLEDSGVDVRIILKWIFGNRDREHGLDCSGSREGQLAGCCESGNVNSGSMKCGEYLDRL